MRGIGEGRRAAVVVGLALVAVASVAALDGRRGAHVRAATPVSWDVGRVERRVAALETPSLASIARPGRPRAPRAEATPAPPAPAPLDPAERAEIAALVRDLRDDHVRRNAQRAMSRLQRRFRERAIPALEEALSSHDRQQRELAAMVLRRFATDGDVAYRPSHRLLEVSVDGLRHDRLPEDPDLGTWNSGADNEASALRFLSVPARARRVWPELRRALGSYDRQQRFLAAALLAWSRCPDDVERTCRELLPHLADNDVASDATIAGGALRALGAPALPHVRAWRPWDEQGRHLRELVLRHLEGDPPGADELASHPSRGVSPRYLDPVRHGGPATTRFRGTFGGPLAARWEELPSRAD